MLNSSAPDMDLVKHVHLDTQAFSEVLRSISSVGHTVMLLCPADDDRMLLLLLLESHTQLHFIINTRHTHLSCYGVSIQRSSGSETALSHFICKTSPCCLWRFVTLSCFRVFSLKLKTLLIISWKLPKMFPADTWCWQAVIKTIMSHLLLLLCTDFLWNQQDY